MAQVRREARVGQRVVGFKAGDDVTLVLQPPRPRADVLPAKAAAKLAGDLVAAGRSVAERLTDAQRLASSGQLDLAHHACERAAELLERIESGYGEVRHHLLDAKSDAENAPAELNEAYQAARDGADLTVQHIAKIREGIEHGLHAVGALIAEADSRVEAPAAATPPARAGSDAESSSAAGARATRAGSAPASSTPAAAPPSRGLTALRTQLGLAADKAVGELGQLITHAEEQVTRVGRAIRGCEDEVVTEAKQAVESARTDVTRAAVRVQTVIVHAEDAVKKAAGSAAKAAAERAEHAIVKIETALKHYKDVVLHALERVRAAVERVVGPLIARAKTMWERLMAELHRLEQQVETGVKALKARLDEILATAKGRLDELGSHSPKALQAIESALEKACHLLDAGNYDEARALVREAEGHLGLAKQAVLDGEAALQSLAKNTKARIYNLSDAVKQELEAAGHAVEDVGRAAARDAAELRDEVVNQVRARIDRWKAVGAAARQAVAEARDKLDADFQRIEHDARNTLEDVRSAFTELRRQLGDVGKALEDAIERLKKLDVAGAMQAVVKIEDLVHGTTASYHRLKGDIEKLMADVSALKDTATELSTHAGDVFKQAGDAFDFTKELPKIVGETIRTEALKLLAEGRKYLDEAIHALEAAAKNAAAVGGVARQAASETLKQICQAAQAAAANALKAGRTALAAAEAASGAVGRAVGAPEKDVQDRAVNACDASLQVTAKAKQAAKAASAAAEHVGKGDAGGARAAVAQAEQQTASASASAEHAQHESLGARAHAEQAHEARTDPTAARARTAASTPDPKVTRSAAAGSVAAPSQPTAGKASGSNQLGEIRDSSHAAAGAEGAAGGSDLLGDIRAGSHAASTPGGDKDAAHLIGSTPQTTPSGRAVEEELSSEKSTAAGDPRGGASQPGKSNEPSVGLLEQLVETVKR